MVGFGLVAGIQSTLGADAEVPRTLGEMVEKGSQGSSQEGVLETLGGELGPLFLQTDQRCLL